MTYTPAPRSSAVCVPLLPARAAKPNPPRPGWQLLYGSQRLPPIFNGKGPSDGLSDLGVFPAATASRGRPVGVFGGGGRINTPGPWIAGGAPPGGSGLGEGLSRLLTGCGRMWPRRGLAALGA